MNRTYYRLEMLRELREPVGMFFTVGLPAFMYLIFGAAQSSRGESAGHGNVSMYVMVSMAVYGAILAITSVGAQAASERILGWGRQLGLTPMTDRTFVLVKACVAVSVAMLPTAIIYVIGALWGARADASVWWQTALLVVVGSAVFSVYGLVCGLWLPPRSAGGAASGSLVVLSFLGNLFVPLSGVLLTIARFTPLYGVAQLARYPLTRGDVVTMDGLSPEPLWIPVANVCAWLAILSVLAVWLVRRGRGRA